MSISRTISEFSSLELHQSCNACPKMKFEQICSMYLEPTKQWTRLGGCANRPKEKVEEKSIGFVDPLKASKRSMQKKI